MKKISLGIAFCLGFIINPIVNNYYDILKIKWYTIKYTCHYKCNKEPSPEIQDLINYPELKKRGMELALKQKWNNIEK